MPPVLTLTLASLSVQAVMDEYIPSLLVSPATKLEANGRERDETAISADSWYGRDITIRIITLRAIAGDVNPADFPSQAVMDKDIPNPVGVAIHQVGGRGSKHHKTTIGTYA